MASKLDGDFARLAKLRAKLNDPETLGRNISRATLDAATELYEGGFYKAQSPWGETWKPAKHPGSRAPGVRSGRLMASRMNPDHGAGILSGVRMRQPRQGGLMQAGAPRPASSEGTRAAGGGKLGGVSQLGTTRATLPWGPSPWDDEFGTTFDRIVHHHFSRI